MENKIEKQCSCLLWARTFEEELISIHHPTCPNRNIEVEAKHHLINLIKALEYEGSMGDGISDEFYDDYINAKYFVKQRVLDKELLNG